jgi:inorganic pyrophosphatase
VSPETTVRCVVEIPKGSRNKYEYDTELNAIRLDRFVSASVVYPTDYGFIPDTLAPDGDPLDALICVSEPTFPGCVVIARPVALCAMEDEKGQDPHIVCVPCADPNWSSVENVQDLADQVRDEIAHFFTIYKDLDSDRHSHVSGWADRAAAWDAISDCRARWAGNALASRRGASG